MMCINKTTNIMKYSNAKIYIIRNKVNDETYIGATIQELQHHLLKQYEISRESKRQHLPLTKAFKEHGFENFTIESLKDFPCETLQALNEEKGAYIREYQPSLNTLKFLTRPERQRIYRQNQREQIKVKNHEYYEKNKEKIRAWNATYNILYRLKNADKIAEKAKETTVCHCGKTVNKKKLKRHQSGSACRKL